MRLLRQALAGQATGSGAAVRLVAVFLASAFAVEFALMVVLSRLIPDSALSLTVAAADATILTLVLAPLAWWLFLKPLQRVHDDRGMLMERVLSAQEQERSRIASDLHDGLGQDLTSMLLHLRMLQHAESLEAVRGHAATLRELVAGAIEVMRRVVRETRPPVLDDLGLVAAVEKRLVDVQAATGIATSITSHGIQQRRLPHAVETALYRIIQEALTNAIRHAEADHVTVVIDATATEVRAEIRDDGDGFDLGKSLSQESRPFGLLDMKERVVPLGGRVDIETAPGRGSAVVVRIPLTARKEAS